MTSKIVVNNIEADAGVSTVTFNSNVERGSSNLHSTGLNVNDTFVHSTGIALGAGSTVGAVTGVTTYYGDGSQLTNLSASNLTGTVADARITTLTASKLSGALPAISGANLTGISAGKILQVQSTTRTDTFSESLGIGALSADALTVNITPSNASNKIFLIAHVSMGLNNDNEVNWVFYKAGSLLTGAAGTAAGNRKPRTTAGDVRWTGTHHTFGGQYLDTAGGTSQITYAVKLGHSANGTKTVYLNRSHTDDNYAYDIRTQSTLTAMEVEA